MTQQELRLIGAKLGINCGGEGGTPGPCPVDGGRPAKKSPGRSQSSGGKKLSQLTKMSMDGQIEFMTDPVVGRHVEIRTRSGKRAHVMVERD